MMKTLLYNDKPVYARTDVTQVGQDAITTAPSPVRFTATPSARYVPSRSPAAVNHVGALYMDQYLAMLLGAVAIAALLLLVFARLEPVPRYLPGVPTPRHEQQQQQQYLPGVPTPHQRQHQQQRYLPGVPTPKN